MGELLTCLWTAMEIITTFLFWRAFFLPRITKGKYILAVTALWLFILAYLFAQYPTKWKPLVAITAYATTSICVNQGKIYWRILIAVLGCILIAAIDNAFCYGASALLGISVKNLIWEKMLYSTVVTAGKMVEIFLAWLFGHLWKNRKTPAVRGRWLLFTMLFFIASASMLYIAFIRFQGTDGVSTEVVVFSIVLFVSNVVFFYLVDSLARSTEKLKETALLNQQLEIQTEQIMALEKSYQTQRRNTHDFRNQLQTILELLSMGNVKEAEDYAQKLLGQQNVRIFAVNSGHPVIDAVLNHKYQQSRGLGVDMQLQVNNLSRVTLPTDMLVVLLSNLLDNAIEGCCRIDGERMIFCKLIAEDTLFLSVRNTSLPVTINNGRIPTSKPNKEEHGYGLGRIQYILDKLGGEYTFTYQDGWFTYAAEIPLKKE